jgi:hypothetical protein
MRFICYLMLLFFSTAQAQAPVVVDADKVTRVSASRNYVRNPDARVNIASVAPGTFTVTRSTTTPLSENGATEFNLSGTGLTTNAALWTVSGFTQGLRSTQCEARFRYRNANSSTVFEVRQGATGSTANVIARVVADVSATDSRIGSIPFPCGDLSVPTWFAVTGTSLSGMELAEVYIGAVQAFGDGANISGWQSYTPTYQGFGTVGVSESFWRRVGDSLEIQARFSTGTHTAVEARISLPNNLVVGAIANTQVVGNYIINNTTSSDVKFSPVISSATATFLAFSLGEYTGTNNPFVELNGNSFPNNRTFSLFARVPIQGWSATNAAVTPSSQNVWGRTTITGSAQASITAAGPSGIVSLSNASWAIRQNFGACQTGASNSEINCKIDNLPAGEYEIKLAAKMFSFATSAAGTLQCKWYVNDGSSNVPFFQSTLQSTNPNNNEQTYPMVMTRVNYSSFSPSRTFTIRAEKPLGSSTTSECALETNNQNAVLMIDRVDQSPSNVFIQSPVKAAGTGVAPIAGEVGFRNKVNLASNQTATNGIYILSGTTTLTTGLYRLKSRCAGISSAGVTYVEAAVSLGSNCSSLITDSRHTYQGPSGTSFFLSNEFDQQVTGSQAFTACCRSDNTSAGQWTTDSYIEAIIKLDR